jgi:hypothetical protein
MKKSFLIVAFASLTSISFAQKVSYGLTGGLTMASYKQKAESVTFTSDSKVGFTLGGFANIAVSDKFTIQPGLNFTQKGGKESEEGFTANTTLNYLEIPVNALYNIEAGSGKLFVGAGPTISYALSGKTKSSGGGESVTTDVKFGSNEDEYKPLELGLNFVAGYSLSNGLLISLNYNLGSNLSNVDGFKENNRYFGIRIGYTFGGGE